MSKNLNPDNSHELAQSLKVKDVFAKLEELYLASVAFGVSLQEQDIGRNKVVVEQVLNHVMNKELYDIYRIGQLSLTQEFSDRRQWLMGLARDWRDLSTYLRADSPLILDGATDIVAKRRSLTNSIIATAARIQGFDKSTGKRPI